MAELKPCPFCGGEARISRESDEDCIGNFHFVECCSCRARSRVHFAGYGNDCPVFYAGIREDWNRRASIGDTPNNLRLLTREEAEDAYANVPWLNDGASSPDWMDRINAVQRKLLEVNGLPAPKDGVPVTGHQSYRGQTPLVSGDSEANKEKG